MNNLSFFSYALMASMGAATKLTAEHKPHIKSYKFHQKPRFGYVSVRGDPGIVSPFDYDGGDDDHPKIDWTFIWFWCFLFSLAVIFTIILVAFLTTDMLQDPEAEKSEKNNNGTNSVKGK